MQEMIEEQRAINQDQLGMIQSQQKIIKDQQAIDEKHEGMIQSQQTLIKKLEERISTLEKR
jgi:hypothetical protein